MVAAVGLFAVVVAVGAGLRMTLLAPHQALTPTPNAHAGILTIRPSADALVCPQDVAWSPDGGSIAVLGALDACDGPGLANIYDATSGKPRAQLRLNDVVTRAVATQAGTADTATFTITFTHALWSPDGRRIALTYAVFARDQQLSGPPFVGVVLADSDGPNVRAFLGASPLALLGTRQIIRGMPFHTLWNLEAGTAAIAADAVPHSFETFTSLRPALRYAWDATGTLAPEAPLSATEAPPAPVGNADGDPAFSIWQPGEAEMRFFDPTAGGGEGLSVGAFMWRTSFAAWSPDGRSLFDAMTVLGRVEPAGHAALTTDDVGALGLSAAPVLPIRDAALQAVCDLLGPGELDRQIAVAWRPDGRMLAAQRVVASLRADFAPANHIVTLYDSATGHVAATLQPEAPPSGLFFDGPSLLRWSPDGSHLLLYDRNLGAIVIWKHDALPA